MSIKTSQAILKCFIDLKSSVWFTLDSEDETLKFTENISVLKTLTGSRAEKSFKCDKTWFRLLSPTQTKH